ncbi:hypothetical protein RHMOL_Rhmol04G0016000 [Rhododendron molle]|uniref:Uncharacterized protein n=1 Tax=Rhododendron molle TaxID=49168 RepID=A0ACC0NX22_RHOML|nr:hypothetical protein RHMOL_Rhmol04G0016000 [Rhododendron molle]
MCKYMRKAKITGDVAVMEILSPQSQPSLGVRTRAKTHALQSLQSNTPPPRNPEPAYLQLRNRRLEKILVNDAKKQQPQPRKNGSGLNPNPSLSPNLNRCLEGEEGFIISDFTKRACNEIEAEDLNDLGFEASFGENYLDFETRESENFVFVGNSDPNVDNSSGFVGNKVLDDMGKLKIGSSLNTSVENSSGFVGNKILDGMGKLKF